MMYRVETSGESLQGLVRRMWEKAPAYRAKMEETGVFPDDIKDPGDLSLLPFTTKDDLRDGYPLGMLACDPKDLMRIHASSGTTGKPTVVAYTKRDLILWSQAMGDCLRIAGVGAEDIVQVAYGYGLFTGGLGLHYGAEDLEATVIPASGGFSERQLMLMEDLGSTVLACTPSYGLKLGEMIRAMDDRDRLNLRVGIFGAEPWSEEMRIRLEDDLGITALDIYGLSEVMGPGVGIECPAQSGLHIDDRLFLAEVIDPDTGRQLPEGEEGELVITTLGKEAMPVVRYRTRDITRVLPGTCGCGRKGTRIERIRGRTDDMLIIRGVNVFPSQVEVALGRVEELSMHYMLEVSERGGMNELTVVSEAAEPLSGEAMAQLTRKTSHQLLSLLGVRVGCRLERPGTLERWDGKAKRVRRVA
ncbi:MAG: phenylacetate--CoA ligase [Synergistales bacterium]|nr:phenylacetate--CoA ligase [Synergistales bacterium]